MMEAVYRCSLCGTRYAEGKTSSVLAEAYLQTLLASGEESASLIGYTGRVYRKTVHRCPDGAFGIGEIIGFRPEGKRMAVKRICPRCGSEYDRPPAMSRVDRSLICPMCGYREALQTAVEHGIMDEAQMEEILGAIKEAESGGTGREQQVRLHDGTGT